jgi:hypothetical protein
VKNIDFGEKERKTWKNDEKRPLLGRFRAQKGAVFGPVLAKNENFRVFSGFLFLNGKSRSKWKKAKSGEKSPPTPPKSAEIGVFGHFDLKSWFKNLGNFRFQKSQISLFGGIFGA